MAKISENRCEASTRSERRCNHFATIELLGVALCNQHADPALAVLLAQGKAQLEERITLARLTHKDGPNFSKKERRMGRTPSGEAETLARMKQEIARGEAVPILPRYKRGRRYPKPR